jgi:hypothetical protein
MAKKQRKANSAQQGPDKAAGNDSSPAPDALPYVKANGNPDPQRAAEFRRNRQVAHQSHALREYGRLIDEMGLPPLSPDEPWRELEPEVFAVVWKCYPQMTKAEWTAMRYVDRVPLLRQALAALKTPSAPDALPAAPAASDGPWSKPDSPKRWGKAFGFSSDTFIRRCQDGSIRHKKLSDRSYQVHVDDLPSPPPTSAQVGTSRHK